MLNLRIEEALVIPEVDTIWIESWFSLEGGAVMYVLQGSERRPMLQTPEMFPSAKKAIKICFVELTEQSI